MSETNRAGDRGNPPRPSAEGAVPSRRLEHYERGGRRLSQEEAAKYPVMAVGDGLPDPEVVQVFESEESFSQFAGRTKHGDRVSHVLAEMRTHRAGKDQNHQHARKRQEKLIRRVQEDLEELAASTGLPMTSPEFHTQASQGSLLAPPIFQSGLLWDLGGGRGALLPVFGVPYPDLNWSCWGNRAASATVNGVMVLCDGAWYTGSALWLFGFLWPTYDLGWFAHRAESVWGT